MDEPFFLKYKTDGGWDAYMNPKEISHIYPKTGWTVVTMRSGYEFVFDMPLQDFIIRVSEDMETARRNLT